MCRVQNLFRTVIVLLAAISQLLLPAAEWLHPACEHSSDTACPTTGSSPRAGNSTTEVQVVCCHQYHSVRSTSSACSDDHHARKTKSDSEVCTDRNGCPSESPDRPHDPLECPICRVLFAAQLNAEVTKTPLCTRQVAFAGPMTAPVDHILRRFRVPVRGPPRG